MNWLTRCIRLTISIALLMSPIVAQGGQVGQKEWQFELTPYFWLTSVDVDSTVNGITSNLNMSFSDLWDQFDLYALAGRFEAWKDNKFGLILDAKFLKMKDLSTVSSQRPIQVNVDTEFRQELIDLGLAYRFKKDLSRGYILHLDPFVTARYSYLKQEIKLRASADGYGGPGTLLGGNESWFDPIVGARLAWIINPKWALAFRGDVGGFGVGSNLTWDALVVIDWRVVEWGSIKLGYNWYYLDYESGSGRDKFAYKGHMHGPWLGFTFYF